MFPDTMIMRKAIRTVSPATHVRQRQRTSTRRDTRTHARRDAEGHARRHAWNTVAQWHTQLPGRQQPAARYARQGEARPKPRAHLSATPPRTLFASTSAFCPFRRRLMMTAAGAVRHHPSTCHPKRPCIPHTHTQQHAIRTAQGRAGQGSAAEHSTAQGTAQQSAGRLETPQCVDGCCPSSRATASQPGTATSKPIDTTGIEPSLTQQQTAHKTPTQNANTERQHKNAPLAFLLPRLQPLQRAAARRCRPRERRRE